MASMNFRKITNIQVAILFAILPSLVACGQKGPLIQQDLQIQQDKQKAQQVRTKEPSKTAILELENSSENNKNEQPQ